MHVTADDLVEALRGQGLRVTRARRAICTVLAVHHDHHLTAGGIEELAREADGVDVDLSTVYRTLDALETVGLVRHLHLGHGPGSFHLTDEERHHHLVCERCGRSVDVPLEEVGTLLARVADRHGFEAPSLHFALSGVCATCAADEVG